MKVAYFLFLVLVLFPVCGHASHRAKKEKKEAQPTAMFVGSDTCIACHDDADKSFEQTSHRTLLASKEPARNGCEACHGPGSAHVNGNGDREKIFRFTATDPEAASPCAACHTALGKDHGHTKVNCVSCHSAHHPGQAKGILVKAGPELCLGCHK